MAINVNPLQLGGVAALAAKNIGDLGLRPYGVDVGAVQKGLAQGLFQGADVLAQRQAALQNLYKTMYEQSQENQRSQWQLQGQAQQGQLNRMKDLDVAQMQAMSQQARTNEMANFHQGFLNEKQNALNVEDAYHQQDIAMRMQGLQQKQQELDFNRALKLKEDQRNQLASLTTGYMYTFNNSKDPSAIQAAKDDAIANGLKSGLINNETAANLKKMNTQQFAAWSAQQQAITQKASDYVAAAKNPLQGQQMMVQTGTDENGQPVFGQAVLDPTKASVNKDQGDLQTAMDNANKLMQISQDYSSHYLQAGGKLQEAAGSWSSYSPSVGKPIVSALSQLGMFEGKSPEELEKMTQNASAFKTEVGYSFLSTIKSLASAAAMRSPEMLKQMEDYLANTKDSPAEFMGHLTGSLKIMLNMAQARSDAIAHGTTLTDADFAKIATDKMTDYLKQGNNKEGSKSYTTPNGQVFDMQAAMKHPELKGMSEEEIAKAYGLQSK